MDYDEPIRQPDQVIRQRLIGNDSDADLDETIARLMSQGLTYDESRDIALSEIEENNRKMKSTAMENKVAELKVINESKDLQRKREFEVASQQLMRERENKIAELDKIVLDISRRLESQQRKLVNDALAYYKSYNSPMTITDQEYTSLNNELNKMTEIKRLNVTNEIVSKIMDLFTTPIEDIEEYQYEEDIEYGGSKKRKSRSRSRSRSKNRSKNRSKSRSKSRSRSRSRSKSNKTKKNKRKN